MDSSDKKKKGLEGWLALSPLMVFLAIFLVTSIFTKDFYSVPVSSAFLLASIYAVITTKGKIKEKIEIFSKGAGNGNVLLMIWIFIMAGAFAATAKSIGSIEATVNLALWILPGKLLLAGLFLAGCLISMSIGTSVGTIVALMPIAAGIAEQSSLSVPMIAAIVVGGAFFGDNLAFISDTTIAATTTQGCNMADKFKTNIWIAGPAALIVAAIYVFIGFGTEVNPEIGEISIIKLIPYISVILMAICGINVLVVLTSGLAMCAVIGLADGLTWSALLGSIGDGIAGMGDLIIVTMLAGGMLEIIRSNGGIDFIVRNLTRRIKGRKGAEFSIAALAGLSNLCTANNTIAILTVGNIAKVIAGRYGIEPKKAASLLDTFSCIVQGMIPYGAQLLMASSLAGISATQIIPWLIYPTALLVVSVLSILFNFPTKKV